MSLAGMDLVPKMDWALDNGLYQRFKVFKERCIDILSGPLHATPEENQVHYLHYWTGERRFKTSFPNGLQKVKSSDNGTEAMSGKKLRTYWYLFEDYTKQRSNSLIALIELKWLFQGSMTLEQFVTKATLLVDKAGYPAGNKDRMVHDTLIADIFNDTVCGKIIKKGPNVTLPQVLEISHLEMATQQSLSQMTHMKPSINYVRYDRKSKNKGSTFISSQQAFSKFHKFGLLPQTANQMPMENLPIQNSNWHYQQVEFVIDVKRKTSNQSEMFCYRYYMQWMW